MGCHKPFARRLFILKHWNACDVWPVARVHWSLVGCHREALSRWWEMDWLRRNTLWLIECYAHRHTHGCDSNRCMDFSELRPTSTTSTTDGVIFTQSYVFWNWSMIGRSFLWNFQNSPFHIRNFVSLMVFFLKKERGGGGINTPSSMKHIVWT